MARRFGQPDLSRLGDDKALAIAAFGESVATYRYIVLAEKSTNAALRTCFDEMVQQENSRRNDLQRLIERLFPSACFFLDPDDKSMVCVGPRLVDARDDARFDEAIKVLIASEKRSASFYARYGAQTSQPEVKHLFVRLSRDGLERVRRLRRIFLDAGKQISEPCPLQFVQGREPSFEK